MTHIGHSVSTPCSDLRLGGYESIHRCAWKRTSLTFRKLMAQLDHYTGQCMPWQLSTPELG
jgi:hypothetical protein